MSNLLLDERPLILLPSLVKKFGFERAAILQQIHWLCSQPKIGIVHDGHKWVWGKYEELCEEYFPFWEPRTLRHHVTKLEKEGVLVSAQLKTDKWDRTKYYRIDYTQIDASMCQHVDTSIGQRDDASLYTKTSSKTSVKSSSSSDENSPPPTKRGHKCKQQSLLNEDPNTPPPNCAAPPPHQALFGAVCAAVGWDHRTLDKASKGQVAQTVGVLKKAGYDAKDVERWVMEVWAKDWRGEKGDKPTIKQLRQEIGKVRELPSRDDWSVQEEEPDWLQGR